MTIFQAGLTVSKANRYETAPSTTEVLNGAQEAEELLVAQTSSTTSTSAEKAAPTIMLREYNVSRADLAIFTQEGSYKKGRPDPFAEVTAASASTGGSSNTSGSGNTGSTGSQTSSDGTYYNSSRVK